MNTPKYSPWGKVQHSETIAKGICRVTTSSHGGLKLSPARGAQVPKNARKAGDWYEEDAEWSIVALVFPECFSEKELESAHVSAKEYYPCEYTLITGLQVKPSESWALRQELNTAI